MSWRLARALETLRSQVNAKWPDRSKASDGSVGDTSHGARKSDHNPDAQGVVKAIDITHDPKGGFDSYAFADMLLRNKDPRISYVISNKRIGSGSAGPSPWKWRKYTGSNPHDHHVHISVKATAAQYDNTAAWQLAGLPLVDPVAAEEFVRPPCTLRKGDKGTEVQTLQGRLNAYWSGLKDVPDTTAIRPAALKIDGDFGDVTLKALKLFQTAHKLTADGVCGPQSWSALN